MKGFCLLLHALSMGVLLATAIPAPLSNNIVGTTSVTGNQLFNRDNTHLEVRKLACEDRCKKPCKNLGMVRVPLTCICACPPGTKAEGKLCLPTNGDQCPEGREKGQDGGCVEKPNGDCKNKGSDGKCLDKPGDNQQKPSKEEKENAFQERKEREKTQYKPKKKEKAFEERKEREKTQYKHSKKEKAFDERKGREKTDFGNRKKRINRVGRCIQMTAVTFGPDLIEEFADETFEASLLTSTEMLEFWDPDAEVDAPLDDPEVEKYLNDEETLSEWFEELDLSGFAAPGKKKSKRDSLDVSILPMDDSKPGSVHHHRLRSALPGDTTSDDHEESADNGHMAVRKEKRFIPALIAGMISFGATIGRAVSAIARGARGAASSIGSFTARGFRLVKEGAKARVPKDEQLSIIRNRIVKKGNFGRCLRGKKADISG